MLRVSHAVAVETELFISLTKLIKISGHFLTITTKKGKKSNRMLKWLKIEGVRPYIVSRIFTVLQRPQNIREKPKI